VSAQAPKAPLEDGSFRHVEACRWQFKAGFGRGGSATNDRLRQVMFFKEKKGTTKRGYNHFRKQTHRRATGAELVIFEIGG